MMENPIEMDDLGVPLFLETPKWSCNPHKLAENNWVSGVIILLLKGPPTPM